MAASERVFRASSELVLDVLSLEDQGVLQDDRMDVAVMAADVLAQALGLRLTARRDMAASCRKACETSGWLDEEQARLAFRERSRSLIANLEKRSSHPAGAILSAFHSAVSGLDPDARSSLRQRIPILLHTQAVRLFGPDRQTEAMALYLWHRALDSLAARRGRVQKALERR